MLQTLTGAATAALLLPLAASAQGPAFQTPGMPTFSYSGLESSQATRFEAGFNPAFSFVVDALGDYADLSGGSSDDGFSLELRTLELTAQAWVDPRAWAYFILAGGEEEVDIEEAAVHWVGFESNSTLRAGRFFLDFGKQMQLHPHELRTLERPLVLRTLLGEEVRGDGVQWDHWVPMGDKTALRWSLGVFQSLLPEETELLEAADATAEVEDRKGLDELSYSARVTAFTEVGEAGTLQLGASARLVPDYQIEFAGTGDIATGLDSSVWGLDLTYGLADATAGSAWTFGLEVLASSGDSSALNPAPGTIDVVDDTLLGYFVFADRAWTRFDSVGVQLSQVELPDGAESDVAEIETYWTHLFSEFQRLRLGFALFDSDVDPDGWRVGLQYTAILGAHGHGVNW